LPTVTTPKDAILVARDSGPSPAVGRPSNSDRAVFQLSVGDERIGGEFSRTDEPQVDFSPGFGSRAIQSCEQFFVLLIVVGR